MKPHGNRALVARDDPSIPDCSDLYGPGWHAPLPPITAGMVVKVCLRGPNDDEWPWATVLRVLDGRIRAVVKSLRRDGAPRGPEAELHQMRPEAHGGGTGEVEIELRAEHVYVVWDEVEVVKAEQRFRVGLKTLQTLLDLSSQGLTAVQIAERLDVPLSRRAETVDAIRLAVGEVRRQ